MNQKAKAHLQDAPDTISSTLALIKSAEFRKKYDVAPIDQKTAFDWRPKWFLTYKFELYPHITDLSAKTDPRLFVIAQNVSPRSLSASQLALAIVTVNAWRRSGMKNKEALQEPPTKSNEELSDLSKTSKATIKRAKKVISDAVNDVIAAAQSGNALELATGNTGVGVWRGSGD